MLNWTVLESTQIQGGRGGRGMREGHVFEAGAFIVWLFVMNGSCELEPCLLNCPLHALPRNGVSK